jgi:hypothetical protein
LIAPHYANGYQTAPTSEMSCIRINASLVILHSAYFPSF